MHDIDLKKLEKGRVDYGDSFVQHTLLYTHPLTPPQMTMVRHYIRC